MASDLIDVGVLPNDGTGTKLRLAFQRINANFAAHDAQLATLGDSVPVSWAVNRDTGHLILTLADGSTVDTGSVIGPETELRLSGSKIQYRPKSSTGGWTDLFDASVVTDAAAAAAASAAGAAASAGAAQTAAGTATAQAGTATAQATAAAGYAADAVAAYDSFDDRYLGAKTADPTADNDGNPLLVGALYFNATTKKMRVFDGAVWQLAYTQITGGVTKFNGREGDVVPQAGDYRADQVTGFSPVTYWLAGG